MAFRPSDIFYAKLAPALEAVNLDPNLPRRQWPHDVLRRVHAELVAETPKDLIAHELWLQSADSHEWWLKTQAFARSAGVMSMLGYAVGLGDRHLDNILLDLSSGELLHIDYNVCFEKGLRLKVSETVPFRMTQTMQAALGVGGTDGAFAACCESVMRVLRSSKETLLTLLEAFVYDPLVDWAAERTIDEQRKEAELSVGISLCASRFDEIDLRWVSGTRRAPPASTATRRARRGPRGALGPRKTAGRARGRGARLARNGRRAAGAAD